MTKPTPIWRHQPVCTDDYIYIGSDSIVKVDVWSYTHNTQLVYVVFGDGRYDYVEYTLRKSNRAAAGVWRAAAWRVYDAYVSPDMQPDDL